jgi:6-phosphofructokinase 1
MPDRSENYLKIRQLGDGSYYSPQRLSDQPGHGQGRFVPADAWIRREIELPFTGTDCLLEKAGPREKIFFDPARTKAAVVTCGGLCPGLNNVVRSLFMELHYRYQIASVLGIRNGYAGLSPSSGLPPLRLTPEIVNHIHKQGGTILGTSRGKQEAKTMVDFLKANEINILFTVGGDGTQRGAHSLVEEIARQGLSIAVVGIPKTIDNDILFCDRTFGFVTAIEKATEVIDLAHNEATSANRGIGLVKLMGRDSGFIACGAAIVSQDTNFVLIPEVDFELDGPGGLLEAIGQRLEQRPHAIIVVAEGAGQHLFCKPDQEHCDLSGNKRYQDIGVYLKERIVEHFKELGQPVDLKYIDPSYIIRSVPANASDAWLCDQLARHAAHAAMAGRTDMIVGSLHGKFVHVPIPLACERRRQVDLEGDLWASVLSSTGQAARFGTTAEPEASPEF